MKALILAIFLIAMSCYSQNITKWAPTGAWSGTLKLMGDSVEVTFPYVSPPRFSKTVIISNELKCNNLFAFRFNIDVADVQLFYVDLLVIGKNGDIWVNRIRAPKYKQSTTRIVFLNDYDQWKAYRSKDNTCFDLTPIAKKQSIGEVKYIAFALRQKGVRTQTYKIQYTDLITDPESVDVELSMLKRFNTDFVGDISPEFKAIDSDQDGHEDYKEIIAGTDPYNKRSLFKLRYIKDKKFKWPSKKGNRYDIMKSYDLKYFWLVEQIYAQTDGELEFSEWANEPCFYKIKLVR